YAAAIPLLLPQCWNNNNMESCDMLAFAHLQLHHVEDAERLYTRACNGGRAESCHMLGRFLDTGQDGFTVNKMRAGVLYEKACKAGVDSACSFLANAIASGYV